MKVRTLVLIIILLLASCLRFYKLDEIPRGLYIDEVSIGYNAYTILTTGKDEYGMYYPLFFKAFGEYKLPIEIYLTSLSMAVFGKNEFAVRFPSALFGTLTVLLIYLFVKKLISINSKQIQSTNQHSKYSLEMRNLKLKIPIVAAALLAISPWHIQFSRGGFEANTALFLYLIGAVLFLQFFTNKRYVWLVLSLLSFVITAYTYNAYKLIAPVTLLFVILNSFHYLKRSRTKFGVTILVAFGLLLPNFFFSDGNSRFLATSAFDKQPLLSYSLIYLQNYLSFFSLPFLFVTGDGFGRHTIVGMGPFFRWELPFLLIGLVALFRQRKTFFTKVVFFLFLIAPITAAFSRPSPHMLRSFLLVIPLTILIAYGLVIVWEKKSMWLKIFLISISLIALYEFGLYLHLYYTHYPMRTALDWGGAYKEVVFAASRYQKDYKHIVVNSSIGMIDTYRNFYNNQLQYGLVGPTWEKPPEWKNEKILYITSSGEKYNPYLEKTQHTLMKNIYLSSSHNGIFAQFWKL